MRLQNAHRRSVILRGLEWQFGQRRMLRMRANSGSSWRRNGKAPRKEVMCAEEESRVVSTVLLLGTPPASSSPTLSPPTTQDSRLLRRSPEVDSLPLCCRAGCGSYTES